MWIWNRNNKECRSFQHVHCQAHTQWPQRKQQMSALRLSSPVHHAGSLWILMPTYSQQLTILFHFAVTAHAVKTISSPGELSLAGWTWISTQKTLYVITCIDAVLKVWGTIFQLPYLMHTVKHRCMSSGMVHTFSSKVNKPTTPFTLILLLIYLCAHVWTHNDGCMHIVAQVVQHTDQISLWMGWRMHDREDWKSNQGYARQVLAWVETCIHLHMHAHKFMHTYTHT